MGIVTELGCLVEKLKGKRKKEKALNLKSYSNI